MLYPLLSDVGRPAAPSASSKHIAQVLLLCPEKTASVADIAKPFGRCCVYARYCGPF